MAEGEPIGCLGEEDSIGGRQYRKMHEMSVNRVARRGRGSFAARVVGAGRSRRDQFLGSDRSDGWSFSGIVVFRSADQSSGISQAHESSS
jgi:hypothetical protein